MASYTIMLNGEKVTHHIFRSKSGIHGANTWRKNFCKNGKIVPLVDAKSSMVNSKNK